MIRVLIVAVLVLLSPALLLAQNASGDLLILPLTRMVVFRAAGCQDATAATGFDLPASNAPAQVCQTYDTTRKYGTLDFDSATQESVFAHFTLPTNYVGGDLDVDIVWFTAATSGNGRWAIRIQCIGNSEAPSGTWETETAVNDTADGTTLDWNVATIANVDDTACDASESLLFEFYRDAADAGDTINSNDISLVSITFLVRGN